MLNGYDNAFDRVNADQFYLIEIPYVHDDQ